MSRYEQPRFTVETTGPGYEIRHYEPYLAAETTVSGGFDATGTTGFRRLAGFIFGQNSSGEKMNMTVPVTRQRAEGGYRYRFFLESRHSEDDLPRPVDDSVRVVRASGGYYAAARYRGSRNEPRFRRAEATLREALRRDGIVATGVPTSAVYNGPVTPPPLRHNEVLLSVDWGATPDAE